MAERTTRDGRPRSSAWIYYGAIAVAAIIVAFQQPATLVLAALSGLYSVYIFRSGRYVWWIW